MVDRSEARRIQDEVRRVLMEHWDPIGISDQEACWDEYDSYIGGAVKLLFENGSGEMLAKYFGGSLGNKWAQYLMKRR
jgi:hypothetical protein